MRVRVWCVIHFQTWRGTWLAGCTCNRHHALIRSWIRLDAAAAAAAATTTACHVHKPAAMTHGAQVHVAPGVKMCRDLEKCVIYMMHVFNYNISPASVK